MAKGQVKVEAYAERLRLRWSYRSKALLFVSRVAGQYHQSQSRGAKGSAD